MIKPMIIIDFKYTKFYFNENGQFHRCDSPAIESVNGYKEWWLNGKRHRKNGPAVEYRDGSTYWYKNGKLHREDGPACDNVNGTKIWYLNGKQYTEQDFNAKIKSLKKVKSR